MHGSNYASTTKHETIISVVVVRIYQKLRLAH